MAASPQPLRCIVILSDKSSGSSALQELLVRYAGARHVEKTRHHEHETLYWTKAASLLRLPQEAMLDSEVPIEAGRARADLVALLRDNLGREPEGVDDRDLVFRGWRALCERYAPLFVEKSPHHLHQWSALELLLACMHANPDVAFLPIGLVRNPIDTVYSSWRRWRSDPQANLAEWLRAYQNLARLARVLGPRLAVVRYEDAVRDPARLDFAFAFAGVVRPPESRSFLRADSVRKWKRDPDFHCWLDASVEALAHDFGYGAKELVPPSISIT